MQESLSLNLEKNLEKTNEGMVSKEAIIAEMKEKNKKVKEPEEAADKTTEEVNQERSKMPGIKNTTTSENFDFVSFLYKDNFIIKYETKGDKDIIYVTNKNDKTAREYNFEYNNSFFKDDDISQPKSNKVEIQTKNVLTRIEFCINAQNLIAEKLAAE